jgi:hypothetical protein
VRMNRSRVSAPLTKRAFIELLSIVLIGTKETKAARRAQPHGACILYLISVAPSTIRVDALRMSRVRPFDCFRRCLPLLAVEIVPRSPSKL